jgi:amidase
VKASRLLGKVKASKKYTFIALYQLSVAHLSLTTIYTTIPKMSTPSFNVLTATATELQELLIAGELTSVQIIETYLAQIGKHNHTGAHLNAIISVAPRKLALQRAAMLDQERRDGKVRSPLHGIPIIVKDCFQLAPEVGIKTTAGAYCFSRETVKETAEVIAQV